MIHTQDAVMIEQMLGLTEVPETIVPEYEARLTLFHRSGASGPLGPLGLVDMLRHLGRLPPQTVDPRDQVEIDWREYPQDGSVQVEVRMQGQWWPGRFNGFIENGTLGIKVDETGHIVDCRKDIVRLVGVEVKPTPPDHDEARVGLIDPEPAAGADWSKVEEGAELVHRGEAAYFVRHVAKTNSVVLNRGEGKKNVSVPAGKVLLAAKQVTQNGASQ